MVWMKTATHSGISQKVVNLFAEWVAGLIQNISVSTSLVTF